MKNSVEFPLRNIPLVLLLVVGTLLVSGNGLCDEEHEQPLLDNATLAAVEIAGPSAAQAGTSGEEVAAVSAELSDDEQREERIRELVEGSGLLLAVLFMFLLGILSDLLGCILPMIPITMSVIGGQAKHSTGRSAVLSVVYVLGIATVYSVLGVVAALTEGIFGSWMGNAWVVGAVAAVFVFLGLAMLGLYRLPIPSFSLSGKVSVKGGSIPGSFVLGLVAGIVVSPCTGPWLLGLVLYVGAVGNVFVGWLLFFGYALGIGAPLIVIGIFPSLLQKLPKAGSWTGEIEKVFGLILIAAALYFVNAVLPPLAMVLAIGVVLLLLAAYFGLIDRIEVRSRIYRTVRGGLIIVSVLLGVYMIVGPLAAGGENLPITRAFFPRSASPENGENGIEGIRWIASHEEGLRLAQRQNKPIMIDFWASWCIECRVLEEKIFRDPLVMKEARRFVCIRPDVDKVEGAEAFKSYGLVGGPPRVIFLSSEGVFLKGRTVSGVPSAESFWETMKLVK